MKKTLLTALAGAVFTALTLTTLYFSPVSIPAPTGDPDRSAETVLSDGQAVITVPTLNAGMIPDPAPKEQSGIRPLSASNAYHEAYNDLYYAMVNVRSTCSLGRYQLTRDSVSALFSDVINHSPELFYVDGRLGISYNRTTGIVSSVTFTYTMTEEEIGEATDFYRSEISRILAEMPETGMSSFDKALWLHDYLCVRFAYDSNLTNYDAYTFFRDRKGVCQGYTLAYMALMNACEIRTDFAASADMNHIWNLIELDGEWYHVDLTWDDPVHTSGSDIPGRVGHDNFLCSDQALSKTGHYNWVSYTCDSTLYDGTALDTVQTALAYLDGGWYFVDKQDGSVKSIEFPSMESKRIFKVEGVWYLWGENRYYVYSYVNICCVDGKLYYSMPNAIGSYDPQEGSFELVTSYSAGEGYIYALYAEESTLHYIVSKAPGGASIRTYTFGIDTAPPPTNPPDTTNPPPSYVEYLNLTCGEDPATALVANATGEMGQTVRILMIGNAARLSTCADPVFSVVFEKNNAAVLRWQAGGNDLDFYQTVTDGIERFTAADGYLLFGVTVNEIPPDAWTRARITLTDRASGQVLFTHVVEN